MCAGSLAGCWILGIFAISSQVYGAHGCHLACLVPLLWRPGGPWDDPATILGQWRAQGRTLWGPGLDFIDFLMILGTYSESFFGIFGSKKKLFSYFVQVAFSVAFESKFGCLGLEKQAFGMEGIAKINFRRNWISCDSRVDFSWFWVALGPLFMAFVVLETGSKIDEFSRWFWGHPRSWAPSGVVVIGWFFGYSKQSRRPETWDMRHEKWEIDPSEDPKYENTKNSRL